MWQTFWTTFSLVFLAELGDKTQLTVLARSAVDKPWLVLCASVLALAFAAFLATLLGSLLQKYISPRVLQVAGGILFLVFGTVMLVSAFRTPAA